jgi:hypothetical protein
LIRATLMPAATSSRMRSSDAGPIVATILVKDRGCSTTWSPSRSLLGESVGMVCGLIGPTKVTAGRSRCRTHGPGGAFSVNKSSPGHRFRRIPRPCKREGGIHYVWRRGFTRTPTCPFFNLIRQSHVLASNRGHTPTGTVNDDGATFWRCPLPAALRILAAPPCPPPPPQKVPSGPRASSQRSPKKIENEPEYSPLLQRAEDVGETWKLPGLVLGIH